MSKAFIQGVDVPMYDFLMLVAYGRLPNFFKIILYLQIVSRSIAISRSFAL